MKTTAFLPEVADREARQQWIEKGALDSQAHAMLKVRDILTRPNSAVFAPEVDARVRAEFPGLVAGDSTPPEGWKRAEPHAHRERGDRRRRQAASEPA
jgi:trimethylamine--corrinoid protein Co-methyltransferase